MDKELRLAIRQIDVSRLNDALRPVKAASDANSQVWLGKPDRFVMDVLLEGLSEDARELLLEEEVTVFDTLFPDATWEVKCAVLDSMASGEWGMKSFQAGGRGYFFSVPDWGAGERPFLLLGAWSPAPDRETYRRAFVETYVRVWDLIGLPPYVGQLASGPLDLMVQAVMKIGGPTKIDEDWSEQVGLVIEDIDPNEVAARAGLPATVTQEIHSQMVKGKLRPRVNTHDAKAAIVALHLASIAT